MSLTNRFFLALAIGSAALVVALSTMLSIASAAVVPTVTGTIHNAGDTVITSAPVGTLVHAHATVASTSASTSPIGTVDFSVYHNQTCSGAPLVQTGVSLSGGVAGSNTHTLTSNGISFRAHYNGQGDLYSPADSACFSITATQQNTPSLSLSLSNSNVQTGSYVYAIPNLTGESSGADGTIRFRVFSNNTCTFQVLDAGSKTVTNGSTPNSDAFQFNVPGTFYWQGVYSGDSENAAATSSCTGAVLTVVATTTTPNPGTTTPGTISGTVFNSLDKDKIQDSGEPGLSGWKVTLYQKASSTAWWYKNKKQKRGYKFQVVQTVTTDGNGNYSFANLQPGKYHVELERRDGWKQKSDDRTLWLDGNTPSADVDFAVYQKNQNNNGNNGHNGNNGNNGNGFPFGNNKDDWRNWWNKLFEFWWEKRNN